jgi:hypothetical protein
VTATAGELVEYADGDDASAFAQMLGGLIQANVESRPEKRRDFDDLATTVGIEVTDIEEAVTLVFKGGHLDIHNGLLPERAITVRGDSDTVMQLSNLRIGPLGLPVYVDATGRDVVRKLLGGSLKIDGMFANIFSLNAVTRLLSVQ